MGFMRKVYHPKYGVGLWGGVTKVGGIGVVTFHHRKYKVAYSKGMVMDFCELQDWNPSEVYLCKANLNKTEVYFEGLLLGAVTPSMTKGKFLCYTGMRTGLDPLSVTVEKRTEQEAIDYLIKNKGLSYER